MSANHQSPNNCTVDRMNTPHHLSHRAKAYYFHEEEKFTVYHKHRRETTITLWEDSQDTSQSGRWCLQTPFERDNTRTRQQSEGGPTYLVLENLVTALVPSETACLANSPGNNKRTAVWISRDEMVDFLL